MSHSTYSRSALEQGSSFRPGETQGALRPENLPGAERQQIEIAVPGHFYIGSTDNLRQRLRQRQANVDAHAAKSCP